MVIGDGGNSRMVSKILQKAKDTTAAIDAVTEGDDGEDLGINGFEFKETLEKLAKDLLEILENSGGCATAGRTHLQRVKGVTAEKYSRVGKLFVLFFARNLQRFPADHDDSNTRWWHLVGRPTLEHCWAQTEEPEINNHNRFDRSLRPATMVVLKLLLIAMELEVDPLENYS
jgi:hypothetical protein